MNTAIEKLEERIEAATAYPQTVKDLTALKACVAALESRIDRVDDKPVICRECGPMWGEVHANYCLTGKALALVNRAMGVSQ